jgi:hypothetical protein
MENSVLATRVIGLLPVTQEAAYSASAPVRKFVSERNFNLAGEVWLEEP